MKIKMKISKYLQIGLLLTFFLPFFRQCSMGPSPEEVEQKRIADSTRVVDSLKIMDSLKIANPGCNIDSIYIKEILKIDISDTSVAIHNDKVDSLIKDSIDKNEAFVEKSASDDSKKESKFAELFLTPGNNYTGLGYILSSVYGLIYYGGATLAFFLWIIGLILKYKKQKLVHFINIIALILFYFTYFDISKYKTDNKLWGYWVCFSWCLVMIIVDILILIKEKKKKSVD